MAFNIKVLNSCQFLAINVSRYDVNVTQADIVLTNVDTNTSYTAVVSYDVTTGKGRINVPISNLPSDNGVYRICVVEAGTTQACKPALIKCDIDCCLVKLTNELIDCACDCPKCSSALAKAQKIFLLIKSAEYALTQAQTSLPGNTAGYLLAAHSKYIKAKEICDNSCGCDC